MPRNAPKPCCKPGCGKLTHSGAYCEGHASYQRKRSDERRGSSSKRGYNYQWQRVRLQHLRNEPLCRYCLAKGLVVEATVVDHIVPHKGDHDLFMDPDNHQSLCKSCHDVKTATLDGGFGRG